jgi:DNA-binding beta-propeller fold protein YncE
MNKRGSILLHLTIAFLFACLAPAAMAALEWQVEETLNVGAETLDVAVTADGKLTFVLTAKGEVLLFSPDGAVLDRIPVGKAVKGIEISSAGDRMYLLSGAEKTLKVVSIEFVQEFTVAGSPFKGPEDAPVTIMEFSDFQ